MTEDDLLKLHDIWRQLRELSDKLNPIIAREAEKQGYESWLTDKGYELRKTEENKK